MPRFILSLKWTELGLARVSDGSFLGIRQEAKDFAETNGLKIISIIDRLVPTPVGPIWIVEGNESDVILVVARFNGWRNVTAQYHRYFASEDEIKALIRKLFVHPLKP
jgi:hypothetical protein